MRIAVIAANGRSGQAFVDEALRAGHEIRAGIMGENPFAANPNLTVVQCNATNFEQVDELLRFSDTAVSLIGHVRGSKANVHQEAIKTIVEVMENRGLYRIVSLTGTGVRIDGDTPSLVDRIANWLINIIDHARIVDGIAHAKLLDDSHLDFTIVRVLKLSGGSAGPFKLTEHGPAKLLTSREEVAKAILNCLENNRYIRGYPVVSK